MAKREGLTQETRIAVILRAGYVCEACGRTPIGEVHHRYIKGMGGSRVEWIHEPWNLLGLCVSCHVYAHGNRRKAEEHGWIVSQSNHPGVVPVSIFRNRRREWVLLTRDGRYGDLRETVNSR